MIMLTRRLTIDRQTPHTDQPLGRRSSSLAGSRKASRNASRHSLSNVASGEGPRRILSHHSQSDNIGMFQIGSNNSTATQSIFVSRDWEWSLFLATRSKITKINFTFIQDSAFNQAALYGTLRKAREKVCISPLLATANNFSRYNLFILFILCGLSAQLANILSVSLNYISSPNSPSKLNLNLTNIHSSALRWLHTVIYRSCPLSICRKTTTQKFLNLLTIHADILNCTKIQLHRWHQSTQQRASSGGWSTSSFSHSPGTDRACLDRRQSPSTCLQLPCHHYGKPKVTIWHSTGKLKLLPVETHK